jgi:hypothetical protein
MTEEFALSFTTALKPTRKFQVDGNVYEILGFEHLTPEQEAEVIAQFARFGVLQAELEMTAKTARGAVLAAQVREVRLSILTRLTTMPKEVAASLHLVQQVKLFEAVDAEPDDDDDDASGTEPATS